MTDITPPPELVQQWEEDWYHSKVKHVELLPYIAAQSAQYGADQELKACCEWLSACGCESYGRELRAARRPKPLSLKEQALIALERQSTRSVPSTASFQDCEIIRQALEQLDDQTSLPRRACRDDCGHDGKPQRD